MVICGNNTHNTPVILHFASLKISKKIFYIKILFYCLNVDFIISLFNISKCKIPFNVEHNMFLSYIIR